MGPECILCRSDKVDEVRYGKFMKKNGVAVHYYCLLLTSNLVQRGDDDDGFLGFLPSDIKKEAGRVSKETCAYCRKKNANIACCANKCRRMFHLVCGINNGCVNQFLGTFRSFCHRHENYAKKIRLPAHGEICSICYDKLGSYKRHLIFKAPCCKSGWFHRWCVAKLAITAGYFFKCPLCNNTDLFRDHFQRRSIFVPDQDAAWETEPNAFADLLERPDTCSADSCKCPRGRKYDTHTFDLLICDVCGSKACHNTCLEKGQGTKYTCKDCETLLCSRELQQTPNRLAEDVPIAITEENQDVDVDVDVESIDTPIKPGRRHRSNVIESDSDSDEESMISEISDDECGPQFNFESLMIRKKIVNPNLNNSGSTEDLQKTGTKSEMPVLTPYKLKSDQEYLPRNKRRYISSDSSPPLIDIYKGPARKKPFLVDNSFDESDNSCTSSSSCFTAGKRITRSQSKVRNTPSEARNLRERSKSSASKISPFSHASWDLSDLDGNISSPKLTRSLSVGNGFIETTRGVFRRSARLRRSSHSEDNSGVLESTVDESCEYSKRNNSTLSLEQFGGCPSLQSCILKYNFKSRQSGVQLAC